MGKRKKIIFIIILINLIFNIVLAIYHYNIGDIPMVMYDLRSVLILLIDILIILLLTYIEIKIGDDKSAKNI